LEPTTTASVQVRADVAPLPGGPLILSVDGELETQTAAEFTAVLAAAAGAGDGPDVLLDLGRLYRLDVVGLDAIAGAAADLARAGRRLALACVRPRVREFLAMVGGEALVPVYPTLEEAGLHM
ncbi:MAG TPA: STAS domain-containing protein, partial [Actinospica sp.]|nr:STAS domain-containing protein [Actinospica sp.]